MVDFGIEYYIQRELSLDEQNVALEFVRFLKEKQLNFYKDNGAYWKDKIYYWVKQEDACVCFIAIKNPDEESKHWTVWAADMGFEWLENEYASDEMKETAWKYVDIVRSAVLVVVEDKKLSSEKSLMMFVDAHLELIIRRMRTYCF